MIPKEWKTVTVSDICRLQNGKGFKPEEWDTVGLPIIRIQNLNGSKNFNYYSGEPEEKWLVEPGQMLFAWAGTKGVSFGPTIWQGETGVLNQHIYKVFPKAGVDNEWLYIALKYVTDRIERKAHGFKATLVHVKKSEIDNQSLSLPPLPEQRDIANILRVWDQAIETVEALIANSQAQKKALMQQLLTGKRRLPGFSGKWETKAIKSISERIQRKNDGGEHPILTISSTVGFVRQDEKYSRYMAGRSIEEYILLRKGEFAYNKGNSKTYQYGCVYDLADYDEGLVPHVYVCFRLQDGLSHRFYKSLFEADYLRPQLGRVVNTGVRNNGLLNITPSAFLAAKVPVPPLEEQEAIASVMEVASRKLLLLQENLEVLNQEKAALMQQLLTGKRRVNVSAEPSTRKEAVNA